MGGVTAITNGRLLDCVGDEPIEDASVVFEDGIIKDVFTGRESVPSKAEIIDASGGTIMPGLIEGHMHIAFSHLDLDGHLSQPPIVTAAWMIKNCRRLLHSGFTTVCDGGLANRGLKNAIEQGLIEGPRLHICNTWLTATGGHLDRLKGLIATETGILENGLCSLPRIVDGRDDATKAAREQFHAGADYIKITATAQAPRVSPEFTEEEIRAFVAAARDQGRFVHAHVQGIEGAKRAIRCGVKVLVHLFQVDDELIQLLKEHDVYCVPTLGMFVGAFFEKANEIDWTPKRRAQLPEIAAAVPEVLESTRKLIQAGCTIGSGSDCIAGIPLEAWEIELKCRCGMSPYDAIKSSTVVNSEIIQMSDFVGSVEVGKSADLIVVSGNPDEVPAVIADASNVKIVIKGGEVKKRIV
ncbi:MAG: amidohydrolase family protein [Spirochaetaceae bacterium]|nr:MAG: amidohydrolase family protein [Spirochaetaceae bacterium]